MKILTIIDVSKSADIAQARCHLNEELQESLQFFTEHVVWEAHTTGDLNRPLPPGK
jgi:hypothetical protein